MNWRRWTRLLVVLAASLVLVLFVANGLDPGWRRPRAGDGGGRPRTDPVPELRVLAFNAAKCSFHEGGLSFADAATIRSRLTVIAEAIRRERIDLCFLSEVVFEAGPGSVDQAEELARLCGFARFAEGENYNFGWPFLRIRSGNALLSRFPMEAIEVQQLPGGKPFWNPTNNRRVLWCDLEVGGEHLLAGSVRNDSFDPGNNLAQTRALLERCSDRPTILAGDFNAEPGSESIELLLASGRFVAAASGAATWPAREPRRRIDHVLAPLGWEILETRTLAIGDSDHLAVVAAFRPAPTSAPR